MRITNIGNSLRIIWAIAAKDIVEAVRSKAMLAVQLSVLFIIVFYRMIPVLLANADAPTVLAYDAGHATLVDKMQNSQAIEVHTGYRSEAHMKQRLANGDMPELGLVIPADYDASEKAVMQGYVMHWVDETQAIELKQAVEDKISHLAGSSVSIELAETPVYLQPESRGLGLLTAQGMCYAIIMIGISLMPHLLLEERRNKTIAVLAISPASPMHITIAKAVAGLFYAIVGVSLAFALNAHLIVQWWLAVLAACCGSLFTIGLGLFLGSLGETRQQTMIWTWGMAAPLFVPMFLSVFDDLLPGWLVAALQWTPSVALLNLLRVSFSNQAGMALVGPRFISILGCTTLVLALVAWRLRQADR
jgi:hypothetical protein